MHKILLFLFGYNLLVLLCSGIAVVRAFAHGEMGWRIDPSWFIELFLIPASAKRLV